MWVDFICIDEQNVEERNAQVSIMKSIYENAEEVYVWLGVSSEDSDLAMRKIGDFGRYLNGLSAQHDNDLHRAVGTLSPEDPTIFGEEGSETFKSWNSIAVLLRRDRWFRAWIIQEATVSMSVTFFCGTSSVSWKAIMYTISIADQLSSFPGLETMSSLGEGFCHRLISLCMSRESKKPRSLMDIMIDFRQSECTDPRDKIYSKLGLATDVAPGDIAVRYDKPIDEVYMDLVRWSYDKGHPFHQLDFLGCVIRSAEKPSQMQMPDRVVPTWVPDWRGALRVTPFGKKMTDINQNEGRVYSAVRDSTVQAQFLGSNFVVKGFTIDRLKSVSSISDDVRGLVEVTWAPPNSNDIYQPTGQTVNDAYLHTIVADIEHSGSSVGVRGHCMDWSFDVKQRKLLETGGDIDQEEIENWTNLVASMKKATFGRRLVWTEQGYMGLAPAAAKVGDQVCALLGGQVLYVLREQANSGVHEFIGESYVHGLMDGEAMNREEKLGSSIRDFVLC